MTEVAMYYGHSHKLAVFLCHSNLSSSDHSIFLSSMALKRKSWVHVCIFILVFWWFFVVVVVVFCFGFFYVGVTPVILEVA